MKTINSTTHTTNILSLQDFCEATKKVYDIEIINIDAILTAPDGWTKLADFWEECSEDYGTYPFHKAVSYIKYAYDFDFCSPFDKAFLMAVCRELCSDGPAGHAWRNHAFFKRALEEAEPEDDHAYHLRVFSSQDCRVSYQHCHYLEQRMMLRYCTSQGINMNAYDSASIFIAEYEKFITNLYPKASSWTSDYWIDIDHILHALQDICKYTYRIDPREYDALLSVFRMEASTYTLTGDRDHDYLRCVFNIKRFSMQWAHIIWPNDTKKNIIKFYFLAKDFVDNDCAFEDITRPCYVYDVDDHVFTHSWIYSVVQKWIDSGELYTRYENDYKKALFEISLNI